MGTRSAVLAALASLLTPDGAGNILLDQSPAQFDNSLKLATTAFFKANAGSMAGTLFVTAATTLTDANVGQAITLGGSSTYTVVLPLSTTVPSGGVVSFRSNAAVAVTLAIQGGDVIGNGVTTPASMSVTQGDTVELVSNGAGSWLHIGGSSFLPQSSLFASSISSSGYQKLPSGLIVQWGNFTTGSSPVAVTFPIAFPNGCTTLAFGVNTITTASMAGSTGGASKTGFSGSGYTYTGATVALTASYIAIGY